MSTKTSAIAIDDAGLTIASGIEVAGDNIADAVKSTLISPNETDRNLEAANVVDGLYAVARALHHVAEAIERRERDETP